MRTLHTSRLSTGSSEELTPTQCLQFAAIGRRRCGVSVVSLLRALRSESLWTGHLAGRAIYDLRGSGSRRTADSAVATWGAGVRRRAATAARVRAVELRRAAPVPRGRAA